MTPGVSTGDALFESVFDAAALGIALVDVDGRFVRCNAALQAMLGYDEPAFRRRRFVDITHPEDSAAHQASFADVMGGIRFSAHLSTRYVHHDGRVVHAEVATSLTPAGLMVCFIKDVSAQWHAQERLRRSQDQLGIALSSVDMGFWEWDVPTDHMMWSEEMAQLVGLSSGPVIGRFGERFYLIHPDDVANVTRTVHEAVADRQRHTLDCEFRIVRPNGDQRWIFAKAHVFRTAAGEPQRVLGAVIDVTQRRMLQEQFLHAQKMEAIGRFASGLAHDFNNTLAIIVGQCDVLRMTAASPATISQGLADIAEAAERAAHLTQQLLTFSRKDTARPRVVDPNAILSRLEAFMRPVAGIHDLELVLTAGTGNIRIDERQLEQAVVNLVINARDAMADKGRILVSTGQADDGMVSIAVSDTGVGIDAATKARLFEPFFTTKPEGRGTGLGLAVVKAVVDEAHGTVHVDSAPGKGATFELRFPPVRADEA
jgi:two-component system cell cycle sensor histidine kinase/response regulator CckA